MQLVGDPGTMWKLSGSFRSRGRLIGFVPTMGYLHEGHLALVRRARAISDRVVVSVFVNPTQFGPGEDFAAYPRNQRRDRRLARDAGADVFYAPRAAAMYPPLYRTQVEVLGLSQLLCGAFRPGHFAGVTTVVLKLLNQVRPHILVMGQKDGQQAIIVRRLLRDLDLEREVRLLVHPTVREPDGLAMSSRNAYLSAAERQQAPLLYAALRAGVALIQGGERRTGVVRRRVRQVLRRATLGRVEYVRLVDTENLLEHDRLPDEVMIAVAARLGRARLIDNVVVRSRRRS